ncbi:SANT and BTB domain regulator of class switch recombination-like [Uloborus diversus]|uniref:SANT and BTB domain regulator of class switch recombination-like n=1 Tax=Uloborus diversus TaxID=327109 RepID=UPI002409133B|nr:SANT and BTB domain regulator of class switch recombination-like [Uloborus diversus]
MSSSSNVPHKKVSKHSPRNPKKSGKPTSARSTSHRSSESSSKSGKNNAAGSSSVGGQWDSSIHTSRREISIRVIDDCKNLEETFSCPYDILINKMPYFKDCLDAEPEGELTISVHCDIVVFRKIMDYITADSQVGSKKFKFDPKYAIHLLVSADFLQMSALVEECLNYCHRHMNSVIENNCPINALNDELLTRLALLFNHREVESLKDPSGKIKEKLYKILLEKLLKPDAKLQNQRIVAKLMKCNLCEQVFATKLQGHISCKSKKASIGPRGELVYTHKRDMTWNLDRHLEDMYQNLHSWRKIYWQIWGLINSLHCITCGTNFACSDFTRCPYHKDNIIFPQTEQTENVHKPGTFPCCGVKAFKFDPVDPLFLLSGCAYRNHAVNASERSSDVFQDMLTYFDLICLPQPNQPIVNENIGLERITPCYSERALFQWLRAFRPNDVELKKVGSKLSVSSDGSGSVNRSAESLAVGITRKEERQPAVFVPILSTLGQADGIPDVKQIWKPGGSLWHNQDAVREHDARQMELLMVELQKIQCSSRTRHNSPRRVEK